MKFFKNTILLFSVFLMFTAFAAAQETGGAKGKVRTNRYRAIAGVNVTAVQSGKNVKAVTTDNKGEFVLDGLKSGTYDFVFKKDGFNTGTLKNVEIGKKKIRDLGSGLILEVDDGSLVIIKGLVFDEEGRSIPGAEIIIEKDLGGDNFQKGSTTYTSSGADAVDRGEFTFRLPEGAAKYRITALYRGKSATKEISVESAEIYHTAITINLTEKQPQ